MRKKN